MAWTINHAGPVAVLTPDGSTDFDWATYFPDKPEGCLLDQLVIQFSAQSDEFICRTHGETGPEIFPFVSGTTSETVAIRLFKGLYKPYIKNSEQTFDTPANVRIILYFAGF